MPRSRLWPHRDAIAEALEAGTSQYALAKTYGVGEATMRDFVNRHVRGFARDNARHARKMDRRRGDPAERLQETMRDTLRKARNAVERAEQRQKEMLP